MGFPAPSLSLSQVYKSALAVRSMRVLASGNFPFSVPAKLAHGRGKKARNLFPSFSPVSCFLGSVPFLFPLPPFYLAKPGRRDPSRRRMTRVRPSPSRLHLLPAMRLLSHLLPREAQGRLLAKIHAKKKSQRNQSESWRFIQANDSMSLWTSLSCRLCSLYKGH